MVTRGLNVGIRIVKMTGHLLDTNVNSPRAVQHLMLVVEA